MRLMYFLGLITLTINSQTKIDEVISVQFPFPIQKSVSNENDTNVTTFFAENNERSFLFIRSVPIDNKGRLLKNLPKNKAELRLAYSRYSEILIKGFNKNNIVLKDTNRFLVHNFEYVKHTFRLESSEIKIGEAIIMFLNGIQYCAIYFDFNDFDEKEKSTFFDSISILNPNDQNQIKG